MGEHVSKTSPAGSRLAGRLDRLGVRRVLAQSRSPQGPATAWAAWILLAVGLVVIALYYLAGPDDQNRIYTAVGSTAVAASALAARRATGRTRLLWLLFVASLALDVSADTVYDYSLASATPPSASDVLFLLSYLPLVGGVVLLVRDLVAVDRAAAAVDAAIVATAVTVVQWMFVTAPVVDRHEASVAGEAVLLSYPALDFFVLVTLARFLTGGLGRDRSYWLVTGAILAWAIGDEANALTPALDVNASWADSFWLLSYLLWGAAALTPSSLESGRDTTHQARGLSRWRISLIAPALLTVPVIVGIEASASRPTHLTALSVGTAVVIALVLLRVFGLLGAAERLRRSERAARSEAERSRQVLAGRNRRLEELDRLKDTFIASVSHELRTPLTSILGNVELALEDDAGADAERRRGPLRIIARNAERLAALVEDLLLVASTREGGMDLSLEPVDVAAVALASLETFSADAAERHVELVLRADPPHPSVLADRERIGQLLDNVLDNALKFTEAGRVELRVKEHGTGALIEVEDTGIGIRREDRRRLFEPFYRGTEAVASGIRGTGLGLSIARAIVEAHGGTIQLKGRRGVGTTCTIVLPAEPHGQDHGAD